MVSPSNNISEKSYLVTQMKEGRPLSICGPHDTTNIYLTHDKKFWDSRRLRVHYEVLDRLAGLVIREGIPQDGKCIFVTGIPGSGKTTMLYQRPDIYGHYAFVDPYDVCEFLFMRLENHGLLPEVSSPTGKLDVRALTSIFFQETLHITAIYFHWLTEFRYNLVLDTSLTDMFFEHPSSRRLQDCGYRSQALWLDCELEVAIERNNMRYRKEQEKDKYGGRFTPENVVRAAYASYIENRSRWNSEMAKK
jgi:hypothetical protein